MRTMMIWGAFSALLLSAPVAVLADQSALPTPIELYRAQGQVLLHEQIAPALRQAAGRAGAPHDVDIVVTSSRDPLELGVENAAGARRLNVSAGFLVFLDVLVDAEVVARMLHREDALPAFVDDVVRYAGVATRVSPGVRNPGRFYPRTGMTKAEYDALFGRQDYQASRSANLVQSLAWIAAHRLTAGSNAPGASPPSSVDRLAARWAWSAEFAPFPLPGAAMLYFAALEPGTGEPEVLRCRTRRALMASLQETRAAAAIPGRLPRGVSEAQLGRWTAMTESVKPYGSCRQKEGGST